MQVWRSTSTMPSARLNDADSEISRRVREIHTTQLRADLRLDPGVRYHGI